MKSARVPQPQRSRPARPEPAPARPAAAAPARPASPEGGGDPLDRAARFGHSLERLAAPLAIPNPPIQGGFWSRLFGGGEDEQHQPLTRAQIAPGPQNYHAVRARETPLSTDVGTGVTVLGAAGSGAGQASGIVGLMGASHATPVGYDIGGGASIAGALGSALDTYHAGREFASGGHLPEDQAVVGLRGTSSLASTALQGASTARQFAEAAGNSGASSMASTVAAPVGMAMGVADMIGGTAQAEMARRRQGRLQGIREDPTADDQARGVAQFAEGSQKTRKVRGWGRALSGALAFGGGLALLLGAATPIGWGLLGGAAAVGGGMALYKQWRKHKEGKALKNDGEYQRRLQESYVHMPTEQHLDEDKWYRRWNPLNTKSSRTHDMVRGQVADTLATNRYHGAQREDIIENLGLDPRTATAQDIARELEG